MSKTVTVDVPGGGQVAYIIDFQTNPALYEPMAEALVLAQQEAAKDPNSGSAVVLSELKGKTVYITDKPTVAAARSGLSVTAVKKLDSTKEPNGTVVPAARAYALGLGESQAKKLIPSIPGGVPDTVIDLGRTVPNTPVIYFTPSMMERYQNTGSSGNRVGDPGRS